MGMDRHEPRYRGELEWGMAGEEWVHYPFYGEGFRERILSELHRAPTQLFQQSRTHPSSICPAPLYPETSGPSLEFIIHPDAPCLLHGACCVHNDRD